MVTEKLISLIAGILVAFTPCVAVLFPITLYRFISDKGTNYKEYLLYAAGFLFTFTLTGVLFQQLFESQIQNGIKFALAIGLIMLGILQFLNRVNPLNLKPVKNTFIFGMIFAVAIGLNPCAMPYTGTIFALSGVEILSNLLLFGIGILIPPTLFLMFGNALLFNSKSISKNMHYFGKLMSILLIASGVYLGMNILEFSHLDLISSSTLILLILFAILKIFLIENSIKDVLKIPRILLVISLLTLWFILTYHCYSIIEIQPKVCSITCEVCKRCLMLFTFFVICGITGALLMEKYRKS